MLGLVEPVGVDLAVVGRIDDLLEAVAVEIGNRRIGDGELDDVPILGARCAVGAGRRQHGPVKAAAAPARAVQLEDERHVVEAHVGGAVVDVADHDQLGDAVAVDVGDDRGAVFEGGAVLDAAIGGTAGDRRTPAARATNPRVPRGASAENGRRDRCLAARSVHGGRSRWFTLALSDDRPCGLAFGQGPASPPWAETASNAIERCTS